MKFLLPMAPSTNNLYTGTKKGMGRIISPGYKSWRLQAGMVLNAQRAGFKALGIRMPLDDDVFVCVIVAFVPLADLDNRFKATLDLLVAHDIITNDTMSVVANIQAFYDEELEPGMMEVIVATREEMLGSAKAIHSEVGHA